MADAAAEVGERLARVEAAVGECLAILRGARKTPAKGRTIRLREFLERASIGRDAFYRNYARFFTDRRPLDKRGHGSPVLLPADEVDLFFSDGVEAVQNFRRRMGRLGRGE